MELDKKLVDSIRETNKDNWDTRHHEKVIRMRIVSDYRCPHCHMVIPIPNNQGDVSTSCGGKADYKVTSRIKVPLHMCKWLYEAITEAENLDDIKELIDKYYYIPVE